MTSTRKPTGAIKHMTYEEVRAEDNRLSSLTHSIRLKMNALDEQADYFDRIAMRWQKKMAAVARRLSELGRMEEPPKGEIPRLLELNKSYCARFIRRVQQRNSIWWNERDPLFRELDAINRRQKHVTKRGWETFGPVDRTRITTLFITPRAIDLETAS